VKGEKLGRELVRLIDKDTQLILTLRNEGELKFKKSDAM